MTELLAGLLQQYDKESVGLYFVDTIPEIMWEMEKKEKKNEAFEIIYALVLSFRFISILGLGRFKEIFPHKNK